MQLKSLGEVSADLRDAGFPEKQSQAIVQAVVNTLASLDLATRADLDQAFAILGRNINGVKAGLTEGVSNLKVDLCKSMDELKKELRELRQILIWGLVIGFSWLSVLLMALGWLVKTGS